MATTTHSNAGPEATVPDPMLDLILQMRRLAAIRDSMPDRQGDEFHRQAIVPLERVFLQTPPSPTSNAGAAAALFQVLTYEMLDDEDARVMRVVAEFLDRSTPCA